MRLALNLLMRKVLQVMALIPMPLLRRFSYILNLEISTILLILIEYGMTVLPHFHLRLPLKRVVRMLMEL